MQNYVWCIHCTEVGPSSGSRVKRSNYVDPYTYNVVSNIASSATPSVAEQSNIIHGEPSWRPSLPQILFYKLAFHSIYCSSLNCYGSLETEVDKSR